MSNNIKLNASSLLETILALLITMLVFGIASMIYVNVLKSGVSLSGLSHRLMLEKMAEETKQKKTYVSERFTEDNFIVDKTIEPYSLQSGLLLLTISLYDSKETLLEEYKELIQPNP